jgi:hypothetical protein
MTALTSEAITLRIVATLYSIVAPPSMGSPS